MQKQNKKYKNQNFKKEAAVLTTLMQLFQILFR